MSWFNIVKDEVTLYIGIDCKPGPIRPDAVLKVLIAGINITGLNIEDEPESKWFGAWKWTWLIERRDYKQHKVEINRRLKELYDSGHIRGAEWGILEDEETGV
jgi:hypothetical protein